MRLSWPNRIADIAPRAFAGGYWLTQLPPANLATRQVAQVARSVSLSGASLIVDAGAAIPVDTFALVGHNLTTAATIRLRGYTSDPRGSYWWDLASGGPVNAATITSTAGATYWGPDGLLKISSGTTGRYTHTFSTGGPCLGLLLEPGRTNHVLWCRDGSRSAWTKSSATATKTATGIDGAPNSATRLTATSSNGRLSQALTLGAATRRWSIYARRITGSGTISLTINNFSSTTTITLTTAWQRFDMTCVDANPTVGIQIATSGDAIEVDCAQFETDATTSCLYPSTPILTTTAAVTRAADTFSGAIASHNAGTMIARIRCIVPRSTATENVIAQGTPVPSGSGRGFVADSSGNISFRGSEGAASQWSLGSTLATSSSVTICGSYAANDIACSVNGAAVTTDTSATVATLATALVNGTLEGTYAVSLVAWFTGAASDADTVSLSGTFSQGSAGYDSGNADAWPAAWVSGTTAEQRDGVVGCSLIVPSSTQTYRYWRLDLTDAANPDGYIELGRLFAGSAWSPAMNAEYGASLGFVDRDQVVEMDSGSEYTRKRQAPRLASFRFPFLTDAEAIGTVIDMQRRLGSSGEVLYEWDPADTTYAPTRRFLGRLQRCDPLSAAFLGRHLAEFEVKELL